MTAPRPSSGKKRAGASFHSLGHEPALDYFNFGSSLWQGRDLPDELGEEYTGELEGLQFLVALWVLRDIRFVILPATVTDAKRKLSQERRVSRLNAFREFTSALQLVSDDPPELDLPSWHRHSTYLRNFLPAVPSTACWNRAVLTGPCQTRCELGT